MKQISTPRGTVVSYETYGSGPPVVLVHGSFRDHITNWQEIKPLLENRFSVYAVARRGRGDSSPTQGHSIEDEAADVASVLRRIGEPAFLLGHSYGALCALEAAALHPAGVEKLVLYEPPGPNITTPAMVKRLRALGEQEEWDKLVELFMLDVLQMPPAEVSEIQASPFWAIWIADAKATLNDLQAFIGYRLDADRYRSLGMPVQLLVGAESPRELYITDALAAVLSDVRIDALEGQGHEGMTTAPAQFVDVISSFLIERALAA